MTINGRSQAMHTTVPHNSAPGGRVEAELNDTNRWRMKDRLKQLGLSWDHRVVDSNSFKDDAYFLKLHRKAQNVIRV